MLLFVCCAASARAATISYDGKDYWINGVNVPWNRFGNDVGGGYEAGWFESFFSQCEANGINCARLWIHCNGWASPEFNGSGYVTGLDSSFLSDFDDLFARAENHGVMVMPCLWSFDMTNNAKGIGLIADAGKTQSYIDNALVPMVQHLANTPNLFAWEISNEPEWSVDRGHVTQAHLQRFCAMIAAALQENSGKMVTLGSASLMWNSDVSPALGNWWSDAALQAQYSSSSAYLDFYQVHYYDWMAGDWDPYDLGRPVSYWQLDKPVLIGETPAATDGVYSMTEQINNSFANGYVGIMFWSYNSDWSSNWDALTAELKTFRDAHPGIVDYGGTVIEPRGPFGGSARAIPGRIEAEDYDTGGEGVAYHDATAGNTGGAYRTDDVDIGTCSEGGFDVGYTATGEWLEFTVDVARAGTYDVSVRVASASAGGALHVEFDGVDKTGQIAFGATGGWDVLTTVTVTGVTLAAGEQVMRVVVETDGFNLGWLEVSGVDSDGDDLPDDWELEYFGDLDETPDGDPDDDGYDNAAELAAQTDPTDPASSPAGGGDSDSDGLPDDWELEYFGDLDETPDGDPDDDGYDNAAELAAGTDPGSAASSPAGGDTTESGCSSAHPKGGGVLTALAAAAAALVALRRRRWRTGRWRG